MSNSELRSIRLEKIRLDLMITIDIFEEVLLQKIGPHYVKPKNRDQVTGNPPWWRHV